MNATHPAISRDKCAYGTGGSILGIGSYLKEHSPETIVNVVEPDNAPVRSRIKKWNPELYIYIVYVRFTHAERFLISVVLYCSSIRCFIQEFQLNIHRQVLHRLLLMLLIPFGVPTYCKYLYSLLLIQLDSVQTRI